MFPFSGDDTFTEDFLKRIKFNLSSIVYLYYIFSEDVRQICRRKSMKEEQMSSKHRNSEQGVWESQIEMIVNWHGHQWVTILTILICQCNYIRLTSLMNVKLVMSNIYHSETHATGVCGFV